MPKTCFREGWASVAYYYSNRKTWLLQSAFGLSGRQRIGRGAPAGEPCRIVLVLLMRAAGHAGCQPACPTSTHPTCHTTDPSCHTSSLEVKKHTQSGSLGGRGIKYMWLQKNCDYYLLWQNTDLLSHYRWISHAQQCSQMDYHTHTFI